MEQTINQPNPTEDLLQDIEQEYTFPEYASTGQRFLNLVIDYLSFYIIYVGLVALIIIASGTDSAIFYFFDNLDPIADRLITTLVYALHMSVVEGASGGRTLGKLITGTRAVRTDGEPISWSNAFGRGFSRIVPFEVISGFSGHPWHDKWTNTMVVKIKKY